MPKIYDNVRESVFKQTAIQAHQRLVPRIPMAIIRRILTFNAVEYIIVDVLGINSKILVALILFILL